jgi:hypothetical protein
MGLDFLREHGGRRLRPYPDQPILFMAEGPEGEEAAKVDLDYERARDEWRPQGVVGAAEAPAELPRRFIDGSHVGHTVTCLFDAEGHPVPVMLAQVGGVCVSAEGGTLRREFAEVERVVSMIIDPFPWHEVESFATALADIGLRLLPASAPLYLREDGSKEPRLSYDFEAMRKQAQDRSNYEMEVLEELALCQRPAVPSLVDGRLEPRLKRTSLQQYPIAGVVKQHREGYLHPHGWRVFYRLEPGERTPAFQLRSEQLPVVSWYLKLDGPRGALPGWGVVRVELPLVHFQQAGEKFDYIDRLSGALFKMRCRQGSYRRGPVSLEPIVRAEESLKALFSPLPSLVQRFYRQTGL